MSLRASANTSASSALMSDGWKTRVRAFAQGAQRFAQRHSVEKSL